MLLLSITLLVAALVLASLVLILSLLAMLASAFLEDSEFSRRLIVLVRTRWRR
jgi:hypothetical protein